MGHRGGGRGKRAEGGGSRPALSLSLPSRGSSCAEAARSAARSAASARPAAISPHGPGAEAGTGPSAAAASCSTSHLEGRAGPAGEIPPLPPARSSPPGRCLRPGPGPPGWSRLGGMPGLRVLVREVIPALNAFPCPFPTSFTLTERALSCRSPSSPLPLGGVTG